MVMTTDSWPTDWLRPDWPAAGRVQALMTTRRGGVSVGPWGDVGGFDGMNLGSHVGDDPEAVARNRALLTAGLPAEPVWLEQVHGVQVLDADLPRAAGTPVADGAITRRPGVVLAVMVADCLPVLLADRRGTVVAVAHAGWRGLAGGVIEATVAAMDVAPGEMQAWLGPAIGPRHFQVGADVLAAFVAQDPGAAALFQPERSDKWLADLPGLARRRLAALGVRWVSGGDLCTVADAARFYSYRRDRTCGRLAGLIWIAESS